MAACVNAPRVVTRDFAVVRDELFVDVSREIARGTILVALRVVVVVVGRTVTDLLVVVARDSVVTVRAGVDVPRGVVDRFFCVEDGTVRVNVVSPEFDVPRRVAARAMSSASMAQDAPNTSAPRHTPKSSLKFFIPFMHRLAKF